MMRSSITRPLVINRRSALLILAWIIPWAAVRQLPNWWLKRAVALHGDAVSGINVQRPHTRTVRPLSELSFESRFGVAPAGGAWSPENSRFGRSTMLARDADGLRYTKQEKLMNRIANLLRFFASFIAPMKVEERTGSVTSRLEIYLSKGRYFSMALVLITHLEDLPRSFAKLFPSSMSRKGKSQMRSFLALEQAAWRVSCVRNIRRRSTSPA